MKVFAFHRQSTYEYFQGLFRYGQGDAMGISRPRRPGRFPARARVLLSAGIAIVGIADVQPYGPVVVVGNSMYPTLIDREVNVSTRDFSKISRGDVVVFRHDGETLIKRVALLPGDRLNVYLVAGTWSIPMSTRAARQLERHHYPKRTELIPMGSVYVLGDNPLVSVDSRAFGPIETTSIQSKILGHEIAGFTTPGAVLTRNSFVRRTNFGESF